MSLTKASYSMIEGAVVNVKDFGAKGDGIHDDTDAIQAAIDYAIKQYDPTETTNNVNSVEYYWQQKAVYFPRGKYQILATLNLSFRNHFTMFGEDKFNTSIWYNPPAPTGGIVIDARCSSWATFKNFQINQGFKARTGIYCAGNGVNAPGSKGNVTENTFRDLMFWCQQGDLSPPYNDYPDTYDPLDAMLCVHTIEGNPGYDSMDDSVIENCLFSANSLNNGFAIATSSGYNRITNCDAFAANGILLGNGAAFALTDSTFVLYGPEVEDGSHNHAMIKYSPEDTLISNIYVTNCYLESNNYYGTGWGAKVAYYFQSATPPAPDLQSRPRMSFRGGLYSAGRNDQFQFDIQANRRATINIYDVDLQGNNQAVIFAPDSSVSIYSKNTASSGSSNTYQTWLPVAYNSLNLHYDNPDYSVSGSSVPDASLTITATNYASGLDFFDMDTALAVSSTTNGNVTITLQKNATITKSITLRSNITIALNGFSLTVNANVYNEGSLTITNIPGSATQGGSLLSATNAILNYGSLKVTNTTMTTAIGAKSGVASFSKVAFSGSGSNIVLDDDAQVYIDGTTSTFVGTGEIVYINGNLGKAVLRRANYTAPATGSWRVGTVVEAITPVSGQYVGSVCTVSGTPGTWNAFGAIL
jgi:hypothetical protein